MKIEEKIVKTLIRQGGPSIFSWSEIYLNPYQGCYHNCVYCDGKSEHYHMHDDFGDRILVKKNAPALFEKFLKSKSFQPVHEKEQSAIDEFFPSLKAIPNSKVLPKSIITIGGGVCDSYQQAEETVKITRKLLKIVYNYQFPLWILTKSNLVLRDIDLIKKINKETYACVNFTITLSDEKTQKIFEPRASTTSERFEAIRILRKEGIHSGVYCYPSLPFIGNTDENIQEIYQCAKKVGAEFIYCNGLTLKPGRSKNEFMQTLRQYYPDLYPKYELLYGNNNKYGHLDHEQFENLGLIRSLHRGYKLGYEIELDYAAKRFVPKGRLTTNLQLSELLRRIVYLKGSILYEARYEVNAFNNAAKLVENSSRDFGKLRGDEFGDIPTNKQIKDVIKEFVLTLKSAYLKDLEKRTYDHLVDKYYTE